MSSTKKCDIYYYYSIGDGYHQEVWQMVPLQYCWWVPPRSVTFGTTIVLLIVTTKKCDFGTLLGRVWCSQYIATPWRNKTCLTNCFGNCLEMYFEYSHVSVAQKLTELRIFGCQGYSRVNLGKIYVFGWLIFLPTNFLTTNLCDNWFFGN